MNKRIRLRFAPSPTGPLHIGGVRTALYAYLFAKQQGGDFILRIEDTDANRYVPGAEEYIIESLKWSGIIPNEGVGFGDGKHAPYRQSERKEIYRKYAEQLVQSGHAYYAFDSNEELESERKRAESSGGAFLYNAFSRKSLKNSLSFTKEEAEHRLGNGDHYVIRLRTPENEEIIFNDIIRGRVSVNSSTIDDKVLLKSDGMPTYHLAHIVDDLLMEITHAVRGEEWLPSAPAHVLIYRYLKAEDNMPQYAHLPLLLKPEGSGKLSKRDGDRLGFPVFPLDWKDPLTGEVSSGYREKGYYPEAFVNMLAFLGWNPGTAQEIFSMDELIRAFSFDHIHKAGARFDPEKTKWFNQQYLHRRNNEELAKEFLPYLEKNLTMDHSLQSTVDRGPWTIDHGLFIQKVCGLVKEKASFVSEFWDLSSYLFVAPKQYDETVIRKKWNDHSKEFFEKLVSNLEALTSFNAADIDAVIKQTAAELKIKPGEIMQLLRVLISGRASGVDLLGMMELIGKNEVCERIARALKIISDEVMK